MVEVHPKNLFVNPFQLSEADCQIHSVELSLLDQGLEPLGRGEFRGRPEPPFHVIPACFWQALPSFEDGIDVHLSDFTPLNLLEFSSSIEERL